MTQTLFVTGTGTGIGKTWITRGLATALRARGQRVVAVKPYETGCAPDALDALAIARAANAPEAALATGLYRARAPVAPYAATLGGEPAPAPIATIVERTRALGRDADALLVEGAGGLLVPIDATHDFADFALALGAPILLVARDGLGVLSHTLTAVVAARARGLDVAAIALSQHPNGDDASRTHNARILEARAHVPAVPVASSADDDDALAHVVASLLRKLPLAP